MTAPFDVIDADGRASSNHRSFKAAQKAFERAPLSLGIVETHPRVFDHAAIDSFLADEDEDERVTQVVSRTTKKSKS